jgi:hypothetical protein
MSSGNISFHSLQPHVERTSGGCDALFILASFFMKARTRLDLLSARGRM